MSEADKMFEELGYEYTEKVNNGEELGGLNE